jgi:hypothetical protein
MLPTRPSCHRPLTNWISKVRQGTLLFVSFIFTDLAPWETLSELNDLAIKSATDEKCVRNPSRVMTQMTKYLHCLLNPVRFKINFKHA